MAQKTVVTVVCHLPHDGAIEGAKSVSFGFDGNAYEIDLCETHSKELREKVGAFADHARPVTGGGRCKSRNRPGRHWYFRQVNSPRSVPVDIQVEQVFDSR